MTGTAAGAMEVGAEENYWWRGKAERNSIEFEYLESKDELNLSNFWIVRLF